MLPMSKGCEYVNTNWYRSNGNYIFNRPIWDEAGRILETEEEALNFGNLGLSEVTKEVLACLVYMGRVSPKGMGMLLDEFERKFAKGMINVRERDGKFTVFEDTRQVLGLAEMMNFLDNDEKVTMDTSVDGVLTGNWFDKLFGTRELLGIFGQLVVLPQTKAREAIRLFGTLYRDLREGVLYAAWAIFKGMDRGKRVVGVVEVRVEGQIWRLEVPHDFDGKRTGLVRMIERVMAQTQRLAQLMDEDGSTLAKFYPEIPYLLDRLVYEVGNGVRQLENAELVRREASLGCVHGEVVLGGRMLNDQWVTKKVRLGEQIESPFGIGSLAWNGVLLGRLGTCPFGTSVSIKKEEEFWK